MRLDGIIGQASSGLDSVSRRLATIAQNVSNADTAGYVRQSVAVSSLVAGGQGNGVRTGVASRTVDAALQAGVFAAGGEVAGHGLRQGALAAIDEASGVPGSGGDLAGLVGALRDGFSALASDPANETQQRAVANQASALALGVNGLAGAVQQQRQAAQDGLVDDVARANAALAAVGRLSDQVIAAQARGEGSADLEDQRDAAIRTVAELTGAKFLPQANGDLLAVSGGTVLPTRSTSGPLSIGAAALAANTPAAAVPALLVNGVARPIVGGRIGAALDLRDNVLPGLQAGLDKFAEDLAAGFSGAGIDLFTDGAGVVPGAVTVGFAGLIRVNPAAQGTPRLVRDGSAAAGAAGDTTRIDAVLRGVLATGSGSLAAQASGLVAGHAGLAATAARGLETEQAVQSRLEGKLEAGSSVSVDSELAEMVRLQNSYGANGKVVAAVQAMWTQLLDSVR